MSLEQLERQSLELPPDQRAELASRILRSLPPTLLDDDQEGITEALRRNEEMDRDPDASMSHAEFLAAFGKKLAS